MALDRLVDSILDYFRLPEHKKNAPPGVGARVAPPQAAPQSAPIAQRAPQSPTAFTPNPVAPQSATEPVVQPRAMPRTPAAAAPATSHAEEEPIRILLVEDDHKWAKLVKAYVSAINHERTFGTLAACRT